MRLRLINRRSCAKVLCCIFMAGIAGCAPRQSHTLDGAATPRSGTIAKVEIRQELINFEDWFVAALKQTADETDTTGTTRRAERNNLQLQAKLLEALHTMTVTEDPIIAYLDTWGLIVRLRLFVTEGQGRTLSSELLPMAPTLPARAETELERIGKLFLTPEKFEESKTGVYRFANQTPIDATYSNLMVNATKVKENEKGIVMKTLSIPMAPIRAMEGVDKTADAISKFQTSADRFTTVVEKLPESSRVQMSTLMDDFEEAEMTQQFIKSLKEFSQSSALLVKVLDSMPQQLRTELTTFLNESEQAQGNLQTTLKTASETITQTELMLGELQKTTTAVNETAEKTNQAAIALKETSESIQRLMSMFTSDKPAEPANPDAPPAFGMRDFDTMMVNIGQSADKISNAVAKLQSTMESESKTEVSEQLSLLIDHLSVRLLQLFVTLFALALVYRFLSRKLHKKAA